MLLNYVNLTTKDWSRSSVRLSNGDYKALCHIAKKLGKSPISFIEDKRVEYEGMIRKSIKFTNFTAYLREQMFIILLEEIEK